MRSERSLTARIKSGLSFSIRSASIRPKRCRGSIETSTGTSRSGRARAAADSAPCRIRGTRWRLLGRIPGVLPDEKAGSLVRRLLRERPMTNSGRTHEGRVALVTGAAQGLGQAIALALAERGARVIATDLAPPHETVRRIGPTAHALQLDVSKEEDW